MNLDSKFDYKSIPILSVAQRCGVAIHRTGKYFIARCPFHADDDPSLVIYPHSNSWTCFGKCQHKSNGHRNSGNAIEFVKQYYHYSYSEALAWLKTNFTYFDPVVISEQKIETVHRVVPHPWVIYWHSLLQDHRQYFYSRGFNDDFIDREMWGWNGQRFCLPVWEGEPGNSDILGVRQRKPDNQEKGFKYIGLKDMNPPTVWGRWYCKNQKTILAFAGEFDAALANQDGFPSFSVVNGIEAMADFPENWPNLWFPDSQRMIVIFDKKEEPYAGRLCQQWNRIKGSMKAKIFSWPLGDFKDYNKFRETNTAQEFEHLILKQG